MRLRRHAEPSFNLPEQRQPASKRSGAEANGNRRPEGGDAGKRRDDRQRERVRHYQACVTNGINGPDRSRPSQLVLPQFARRHFAAQVADRDRQNGDLIAAAAQRRSDRVIVREAIGDADETAYLGEDFAPACNRRAEAGLRKAKSQADDDVRQKMRVDAKGGDSGPYPGRSKAVVEASHSADVAPLQRSNDAREITGIYPHVAVGHHDSCLFE
jgi:hypothetical protein